MVILRAIDPQTDARDHYEMNLDPAMHLWTGNEVLPSIEEAMSELCRFVGRKDLTMWAIVDRASGLMIGRFFICLERRGDELVAGEGNRIAKPFWRKGHNRQARRLVFEYVFNVLKADRIETQCWTENVNSYQSIKAHGFALVSESQEYNAKHEKIMSKSLFEMTREQWMLRSAAILGSVETSKSFSAPSAPLRQGRLESHGDDLH